MFSGKEHSLEVNESIGCHFSDEIAESECFMGLHSIQGNMQALSSLRSEVTSLRSQQAGQD